MTDIRAAAKDAAARIAACESKGTHAFLAWSEASLLAQAETLAIVAYRQPMTKAAVERIRGVDADYAIRSLVHRRLVVELGRADAPGRPILYGTGSEFLERFGLTSLEDLPVVDPAVAERLTIPEAEAAASAAPSALAGGTGDGTAAEQPAGRTR